MNVLTSAVIEPMGKDVHPRIVNLPSKRRWRMVDTLDKTVTSPRANFAVTCVAAIAGIISFLVWWDSHTTRMATIESNQLYQQQEITQILGTLHEVAVSMSTGLRPDDVNGHLHALDSRVDDQEKRLRSDEERITRSITLLEEANRARK